MITRILFVLLFLSGCTQQAAMARSLSPCRTGAVEWNDKPIKEIVDASDVIYVGTVVDFVEDRSKPGYDGYYTVSSNGGELKGGWHGPRKIYGRKPYEYPPQIYFTIDDRHSKINPDRVFGGVSGHLVQGSHCPLVPRFVIGYRYLILLGTESRMSFEPIHSFTTDKWYKMVREEALK